MTITLTNYLQFIARGATIPAGSQIVNDLSGQYDGLMTFILVISIAAVYLVIASFTWALIPNDWREGDQAEVGPLAALFWPATFVLLIIHCLMNVGPWTVNALRHKK